MRLLQGQAERVGFEPTRACTLPLFESGTFDHSDISPLCSITYGSPCDNHFFYSIVPKHATALCKGQSANPKYLPLKDHQTSLLILIPICVQRDNFARKAGQAAPLLRQGLNGFRAIRTTERNLV